MTINNIEYCSHELIFKNVFRTSQTKSSTRQVFYIRLTTEEGKYFYGECAPLPQFGPEDYPEVENELKRLAGKTNVHLPETEMEVKTFLNELTNVPAIQYGVEQALLQKLALSGNMPSLLQEKKEINVNALVNLLSLDEVIASVTRLYEAGYTTIKLKAGRNKFEDDLEILASINKRYGDKINLRLDANGKWTHREASGYLTQMRNFNIEYVEQPVKGTAELIELSYNSKIPLAADESIRDIVDAYKLLESSAVKYFVIKPMLIGGYYKCKEIAEATDKKNVKVIVSSSLESNVGRRHLAAITAAIEGDSAHGLGTSDLFINDPVTDAFPVVKGKISYSPEQLGLENIPFGDAL